MKIKISELQRLVKHVLQRHFNAKDAQTIADVMLYAELSNKKAHGVERMFTGYPAEFSFHAARKPRIRKTSGTTIVIDGFGNPGMLLGPLALKEVARLASKNGIGLAAINGLGSSAGALGYYSHELAMRGLISLLMAQTVPLAAAYGGIKPVLGTNPISIGIPKKPEPFVLDFSTTEISGGEVIVAKEKGLKLRPGIAINKNGKPTTSPAEALAGALLSFGDHYKSSGLAIAIELIAGTMTNTGSGVSRAQNAGCLFIAIDPKSLGGENATRHLDVLYKKIIRSGKRPGMSPRIPGARSASIRQRNLGRGTVDIDVAVLDKLKAVLRIGKKK